MQGISLEGAQTEKDFRFRDTLSAHRAHLKSRHRGLHASTRANGSANGRQGYGFRAFVLVRPVELFTNTQVRGLSTTYNYDWTQCNLGGHVPSGVTAHGSPAGPLQFDRLEAALGTGFH
jgi:hypothetical protein